MKKVFYGWWMVAAAFLTFGLSTGLTYYNIPFFYDYFAKTYGWRPVDITRGFFYAAICTLWVGPVLLPHFSPRKLIVLGTGLNCIAFLCWGLMGSNIWVYWGIWAIWTLGYFLSGPIPHQIIIANWFRTNRGKAMGLLYVGISIIGFLGSFLVKPLTERFGFHFALMMVGVMVLLAWPLAIFVLRDKPAEMGLYPDGADAPPAEVSAVPRSFKDLTSRYSFWLLVAGSMCSIRLRDDARAGRFQAVLINDVDRLARDVAHLGIIKRDLEKNNVRIIFRKLPFETSPISNLMVNILGSFAEFERELITDRMRRGRRHKVEYRKQYLGSNTAYGYRYRRMDRINGKAGRLEVEPYEAAVVQQMFAWVDTEWISASRVTRRLNDRHVPTRKGAPWGNSSVLRILHSEMYAGVWHYNKFQCCEPRQRRSKAAYRKRIKSSLRLRPREEWIPLELPERLRLIHRDRWQQVQTRLKQNIAFSPRNEKHQYLLKGLVQCGGCGSRYVGDSWHGRFYYRCSSRCKLLPAIRESRLEELVVEAVKKKIPGTDLGSLTRAELQSFLRAAISAVIFKGSRVTIHSRLASEPSFPPL